MSELLKHLVKQHGTLGELLGAFREPLSPAAHDALVASGRWLTNLGEHEAALGALLPAMATYQGDVDGWALLAVALAKAGHPELAIHAVGRGLANDPKRIDLWCIYAELNLDTLRFGEVTRAISNAVALDPEGKHPSGLRARALIGKTERLLRQAVG